MSIGTQGQILFLLLSLNLLDVLNYVVNSNY